MSRHCNFQIQRTVEGGAFDFLHRRVQMVAIISVAVSAASFCIPAVGTASDTAKGESVFIRQCALCHTIAKGGPNRFGPNLFGIVDRKAGTAPGYEYSSAFVAMANWTWSPDGIASFIAAPGKTIPGNRMSIFQGIAERDEQDLLAYLATQK